MTRSYTNNLLAKGNAGVDKRYVDISFALSTVPIPRPCVPTMQANDENAFKSPDTGGRSGVLAGGGTIGAPNLMWCGGGGGV